MDPRIARSQQPQPNAEPAVRFGRGTYVVKLTDPEGVRWERVVLE